MMFIPHRWISSDDDASCMRCGITGEQFDFISVVAVIPTCTFSEMTEWYNAQPDLIPESVIGEARRLFGVA